MKNIIKGKEPSSLTEYRCSLKEENISNPKSARSIFDNYPDKSKELKKSLLEEQGFICCYCMQRIEHKSTTKIEHFKPISIYPRKALDYKNLFVACNGVTSISNDVDKNKIHHCDTSKGDCESKQRTNANKCNLTINPPDCEKYITGYSHHGEIEFLDAVENDINEILNLNNHILKRNRVNTLKAVITEINKITKSRKSLWKVNTIKNKIKHYKDRDSHGKYKPYCQVVIYSLEKRLARQ
jgi:uncharacterized protein (TIGR02646 family)